MAETLGEKLRAAREARGISISEVAEQTRIAPMYIECIENDNFKPLPGGIFNKGFVKSYARFIGIDEQEALQDYSRQMAQTDGPANLDEVRSYRPEVLTDDRASQSSLSTILFAGLILALVTGAIYMLVSYLRSGPTETAVVTNNNVSNSNQTTVSPETSVTPAAAGDVPTMQNLKVEFRSTEPISLRATSDGNTSENIVTPGSAQTFEPKQSLKLSYAKSLAPAAQLFINGKQIALPMQPENPKRIPIEIEINAANVAHIWQTGQYAFASQVPAATTPAPAAATPAPAGTPRPAANTAARANANTASNRPTATRTPIVVTNAPRATPRPNED